MGIILSFVPLGLPLAHQVLTAACGIVICMMSLVCIGGFFRLIWAATVIMQYIYIYIFMIFLKY